MRLPVVLPTCFLILLLGQGCSKPKPIPKATIQVQVSSEPEHAALFLAGQPIGVAPRALGVASAEDLVKMTATLDGETVAEKRIRFLSLDQAEVIFYFGANRSALGKALGLSKLLVFDYGAGVTFAVSKAELKPEFQPLVTRQADLLKNQFAGLDLFICGHTDAQGSADRNLALSLERARAVSRELVARGLSVDRMKIQGFGSTYPLATNTTDQGRAMNRRTEIILPQ